MFYSGISRHIYTSIYLYESVALVEAAQPFSLSSALFGRRWEFLWLCGCSVCQAKWNILIIPNNQFFGDYALSNNHFPTIKRNPKK